METHGLTSKARGFPLAKGAGGLPWEMWTGLGLEPSPGLGNGGFTGALSWLSVRTGWSLTCEGNWALFSFFQSLNWALGQETRR